MRRRQLLAASAAALSAELPLRGFAVTRPARPAAAMASAIAPNATELARELAAGRLGAEALARDCLGRIAKLDRAGPRLHSVICTNPDALAIARQLDADLRAGTKRGPLHGLPVLVKDNIASGDRMATTAGSLALEGQRAPRDAFVVRRLREAGAVILGKANLSEWANIRSTRSTSGWSALGGLCRNPHGLDRNTSGSSSGSAAAVAAGLVPFAVGTETDGSIVSPASICGIVGLKPTVGRLSRDGVVPISRTQDTPGPMARTVADAALLYAAMLGRDGADAATASAPSDGLEALLALPPNALQGARLGIARGHFTGHAAVDALIDRAIEAMQRLGATVVDPVDLPQPEYVNAMLKVLLYEMQADLPAYLAAFAPNAPVKSIADIVAFNAAHAEREMAWFGQEFFERAAKLGGLETESYRVALAECRKASREDGLDKVFREHRLDAVIAPTGGPAWLTDPVNGDHFTASFATPAAAAGYPHLTVPAGFVSGLPIGVSFVGPAWSEARLLAFGHAYEQATKLARPPGFAPRSTPAG